MRWSPPASAPSACSRRATRSPTSLLSAASERVEAGLEPAGLIAFGVGQDMPLLLAGLADVGRARTEPQEALQFGVLIAVGRVDVDVQPGFPRLRLIPAAEDDRRLRAAEPFARPDLHRAV